ncbi:MAG TPA: glycine cleavage system protein T, partial [Parachlamydiaceae bacterium]|nr:glycine cleavage system protein T [Parachlamydiaceae bacterium]
MRTALFEKHLLEGAKMIDFAGWQMPLQYEGILKEHLTVRHSVGLFDVSHMGVIEVFGHEAAKLLDTLSTNAILGKKKHTAIYTVWPREDGTTVDDLIVYPMNETKYFLVVNAANRAKSLNHLKKHASGFSVEIKDRYQDMGILSLQGKNALSLISPLFLEAKHLKKMEFAEVSYHGHKIILS